MQRLKCRNAEEGAKQDAKDSVHAPSAGANLTQLILIVKSRLVSTAAVRSRESPGAKPRQLLAGARLSRPIAGREQDGEAKPVSHFDTLSANTCCIFPPDEGFYWRPPLPLISGRQPKFDRQASARAVSRPAVGQQRSPQGR